MSIKILQILEATVGGTRRHLVSLLAGLDKKRFQIEVAAPRIRYTTQDDTSFYDEVQALDIPFHQVDMTRAISLGQDWRAYRQLRWLMQQGHYDIVHTHSSKAGFLGRLAGKQQGILTVYTPNGYYFLDEKRGIKTAVYKQLERFAGFFTDKLIAVSQSEYEATKLAHIVPTSKLSLIPNGIRPLSSDTELATKVRQELNIPDDGFVVGTISRYIPQKDPLTWVQAASLILEECPNTYFIWCGEGEMRAQTESFASQLGIHQQFRFLGFRTDANKIMNSFDLFVLSSIFEGLPFSLLEAMSLGLPVVATDVVGNRDVIINGHTGFLVPPRDPERLAQSIIILLHDKQLRNQMGQNGHQLVLDKFTVREMVTHVQNLYIQMLSK